MALAPGTPLLPRSRLDALAGLGEARAAPAGMAERLEND